MTFWTITPKSGAPQELVNRLPKAAEHDPVYNWFVPATDSPPNVPALWSSDV